MIPPAVSGSVYGVILNDQASIEALGQQLHQAPYQQPNKAPVLYIKPGNTQVDSGTQVVLPAGENAVEIGATLGLVIGLPTSRIQAKDAQKHIAGVVIVADLSLPHSSYFRPAIREKCFDGACPISPDVVALPLAEIDSLVISTLVNGELVAQRPLNNLLRPTEQLLQDVSEFMSLSAGDVLLLGVSFQAPEARAGDHVKVEIVAVGAVEFTLASGVSR